MAIACLEGSEEITGYKARYLELPAFDVTGFTKIVESGGELYRELRSDGRWQLLRSIAGDDGTLYGVASLDKECPRGVHDAGQAAQVRMTVETTAVRDQVRRSRRPHGDRAEPDKAPRQHL